MKLSLALTLVGAASASNLRVPEFMTASEDEQCCVGACEVEGEEKYYSIDTRHDLCGECCMKPSLYGLYHIFERGLEKAEDGDVNPCTTLGYPVYTGETPTHGVWPVTMTLDLYDHADAEIVDPYPITLEDEEEPCCEDACTEEGEEKYYSIDKLHDMCGECCMNPKDYNLYHVFERGLKKAEDGDLSPCTGLGYPAYDSTVTHGAGSIKMTLDLYNHAEDKGEDDEMCCEGECANAGEEKYYSIDTRHDLCGECCMNPKDYNLYHIFERGLKKAEDGDFSPCTGLGYPVYTGETPTHGAGPIKMTLDLYDHADSDKVEVVASFMEDSECADTEEVCVYNDAGDSQCCTAGEFCIQGVGCRC